MAKISISKLSIKELEALQLEATALLAEKQASADKISTIVKKLLKTIEESGLVPADVVGELHRVSYLKQSSSKPAASGARGPAPVKYRDGSNAWSGRGIKPRWATEYIQANGSLDGALVSP